MQYVSNKSVFIVFYLDLHSSLLLLAALLVLMYFCLRAIVFLSICLILPLAGNKDLYKFPRPRLRQRPIPRY